MTIARFLQEVFDNQILIAALVGWLLAQVVKIPVEYLRTKEWNWALLVSTGGMPSSHTSLVSSLAVGVGLWEGFDTIAFAICFVLAVVVIYDATGIRRQAGQHAALINAIINELAAGHPIKEQQEKELKEILGHTWIEAIGGILWGILFAWLFWIFD